MTSDLVRKLLASTAAVGALSVGGCSTMGGSDPVAVLDALGKVYGHCERTVTYAASVGPLNPGSGATINGTIRCPASVNPAAPP